MIYRKQENSQDWEKIVNLDDKLNSNKYVDIFANDKIVPTTPNISITGNEVQNSIHVEVNSNDFGSKYKYYVESYDSSSLELLDISK